MNQLKKLKLVKYNKSLQGRININIIIYKSFSGRHTTFGKKMEKLFAI